MTLWQLHSDVTEDLLRPFRYGVDISLEGHDLISMEQGVRTSAYVWLASQLGWEAVASSGVSVHRDCVRDSGLLLMKVSEQ